MKNDVNVSPLCNVRNNCQPSLGQVTIDILPDDAIIEVFSFYVDLNAQGENAWQTLVHVCRRWRYIVFRSPRRLDLRLVCTPRTAVRKLLDVWPTMPIIIRNSGDATLLAEGADNVMAALEHNHRVCQIDLFDVPNSLLERFAVLPGLLKPFPVLRDLELWTNDPSAQALPETFLSGCAPRLRSLYLNGIPFPALPRLLLSASGLVELTIQDIPDSGYILPETIAACLAALTRLKSLELDFRSPQSRPDQASRRPPPPTRAVLPALTSLSFFGVSEYLEDIVARINCPLLDYVWITFFFQPVFDTPQLHQFISRTEMLNSRNLAEVIFYDHSVTVTFYSQKRTDRPGLVLRIPCTWSDSQLPSMAQVCRSSFPPFSTLEHLEIHNHRNWQDHIVGNGTHWLELLRPYTAVKNLFLRKGIPVHVAPALQELAEGRVTGVLPALQNLFVAGLEPRGSVQGTIRQFVGARLLSGHPVTLRHL